MLDRGTYEGLKAGIHALLLLLALVCFVYNTWAYVKRVETHLLAGSLIYLALIVWELVLVVGHVREWS